MRDAILGQLASITNHLPLKNRHIILRRTETAVSEGGYYIVKCHSSPATVSYMTVITKER